MPLSTEGSGIDLLPSVRSQGRGTNLGGGGGRERYLLTCPYPLKVQACRPQNSYSV